MKWANGDVTRTTIGTERGRTIFLEFDVKPNREYRRVNQL